MKIPALLTALALLAVPPTPAQSVKADDLAASESSPAPVQQPRLARIALEDEVTDESVASLIEQIRAANDQGADQILMLINSPGGSVMAGIRLSHEMEASRAPMLCVVDGLAASMATYLLQSCTVRAMTKRSALMFHEPAVGAMGAVRPSDAARMWRELRVINRMLAEHIAARMNLTVEQYIAKTDGAEWWMSWNDALKWGAVDVVVDSPNASLRH